MRSTDLWTALAILALAVFVTAWPGHPDEIRIILIDDPSLSEYGSVEVRGLWLDPALESSVTFWSERLTVYTGEGPPRSDQPAVLGDYQLATDRIRFTPRFPFLAGQPYFVRWFGLEPSGLPVESIIRLPESERDPTTFVEGIYPSHSSLPQNVLKLYVQFSAPMSRDEAVEHLRLLRSDGSEVPYPFVAPRYELWNGRADRLTVFFDPGRIKRGVGPNETLGPTLEIGESYRLVVDAKWLDARGQTLSESFEKHFTITAPDDEQPRTEAWTWTPPRTSSAPLIIEFPEPLDHALLERLLVVVDGRGQRIQGEIDITNFEQRWAFQPEKPWPPGIYALEVSTALEDIAGNSLRRTFETELGKRGTSQTRALPFTVESDGSN